MSTQIRSLKDWVSAWPKSGDVWSIHVDELNDWQPATQSYPSWRAELLSLFAAAQHALDGPGVVVVAFSFEASEKLETFESLPSLTVDFFTPPSLYLLNHKLDFPVAGEQYSRLLAKAEFDQLPDGGAVVVRSARSIQALENSWEFDNTLYITSRFGD